MTKILEISKTFESRLATSARIARQAGNTAKSRQEVMEKIPDDLKDFSRAMHSIAALSTELADQVEEKAKIIAIANWQDRETEELLGMLEGLADGLVDLSTVVHPKNIQFSSNYLLAVMTSANDEAMAEAIGRLTPEEWQKLVEARAGGKS